jgi:hypothetical protein
LIDDSPRLRTDIWVSAYIRRCEIAGAFALIRRRGANEAGSLLIRLDCLDGRTALFGPAPMAGQASAHANMSGVDRLWHCLHDDAWITSEASGARIQRAINRDPDLWVIELEDPQGRCFLDLANGPLA